MPLTQQRTDERLLGAASALCNYAYAVQNS